MPLKSSGCRVAILALFAGLTSITWAQWGDLRSFDSGREMYVPWAISQGQMLYRDLWFPYGPLAPYWHALLFRLFGPHLNVLYFSGLSIILGIAFLLFSLSRHVLPNIAAFLVTTCFLMQAFLPGLFNYVLPYAYATSLGLLFSLVFLLFFVKYFANRSWEYLLVAGLGAGFALLSKQEFGAACYLILGFWAIVDGCHRHRRKALAAALLFVAPGVLVNAAVYGWFTWKLSPSFLFRENIHTPFSHYMSAIGYQWIERQGMRFGAGEILANLIITGVGLVLWYWSAVLMGKAFSSRRIFLFFWLVYLVLLVAVSLGYRECCGLVAPFVVSLFVFPAGMSGVVFVFCTWKLIRREFHEPGDVTILMICGFSLLVALRIISKVVPFGYAIYYSGTLFLAFLVALLVLLQHAVRTRAQEHQLRVGVAILALYGLGLMWIQCPRRDMYQQRLWTDRGAIYTDAAEAMWFPKAIDFIKEKSRQGLRVLVLPEESALYFFSGTLAPTRWYGLQPGILSPPEREKEFTQILEQTGIEYILLSNRTTEEYGLPFFGLDYSKHVYQWILANYDLVGELGQFSRLTPKKFAMQVYRFRGSVGSR